MVSWRGGLLLAVTAAVAAGAPNDRKRPPWERAPVEAGRLLFLENCSVCHETVKPKSPKMGPSLVRFQKIPEDRVKPFRDYVMQRVKKGGILMPAFGDYLSDEQIRHIAEYVFRR